MEINFTHNYNVFFIGPIAEILVVVLIIISASVSITKNKNLAKYRKILYMIILIGGMYIPFYSAITTLNLSMFKENPYNTEITEGIIEETGMIKFKSDQLRRYGKPDKVVISNEEYWILDIDDFEVGDNVIIEYFTESKTIKSIYKSED